MLRDGKGSFISSTVIVRASHWDKTKLQIGLFVKSKSSPKLSNKLLRFHCGFLKNNAISNAPIIQTRGLIIKESTLERIKNIYFVSLVLL